MSTRRKKADDTLVDIVEVSGKAQNIFERYQKFIVYGGGALLVLLAAFIAYKFLYQVPRENEAKEQMYQAEYQFARDSFALALTNPGGGFEGFLGIIEKYSGTASANLANYYSGVAYLHLGKVDAAISYLEDFKPGGKVTPIMKLGLLGDAYSEKSDFDRALSYYKQAANATDNEVLSPYYLMKLGLLQENQGKNEEALKTYEQIKSKYPNSTEGKEIDKFITRISG